MKYLLPFDENLNNLLQFWTVLGNKRSICNDESVFDDDPQDVVVTVKILPRHEI